MSFELDPLWVSAITTILLAIFTGIYAIETWKIRNHSIKPQFSLLPTNYMGIPPYSFPRDLYLINTGGLAKEISILILENHNPIRDFYIPSLSIGNQADLEIDPRTCQQNNSLIVVLIEFRNIYGREDKQLLRLDYDAMTTNTQTVPHIY